MYYVLIALILFLHKVMNMSPSTVDEALFLQNRDLLAQIQGNSAIAFAQLGNKAPLPTQTMLRPMPRTVLPSARPFMAGVPQSQRPAVQPQHQQALMQAMLQQQMMNNNAPAAYLQNNNVAVAAAAAAAVAATQQVSEKMR